MSNIKKLKIPLRTCIGCGIQKSKKEMIRIVKSPEDEIFLDRSSRANGRGAYICPSTDCMHLAIKKGGLNRSFKMNIQKEIYDKLLEEMKQIDT